MHARGASMVYMSSSTILLTACNDDLRNEGQDGCVPIGLLPKPRQIEPLRVIHSIYIIDRGAADL